MSEATTEVVKPLNKTEQAALAASEKRIMAGLASFIEVGTALAEIRDKRLYRDGHATFEDYCQTRWNLSRPYAYQTIDAADVATKMSAIADTPVVNEAQARELAKIAKHDSIERAAEVLKEVAAKGKVTAKAIKEAVAPPPVKPTPKPTPPTVDDDDTVVEDVDNPYTALLAWCTWHHANPEVEIPIGEIEMIVNTVNKCRKPHGVNGLFAQ